MTRLVVILVALVAAGAAGASEVELRHAEDLLTNGNPSWRETSLRAEWSPERRAGIGVTGSEAERFSLRDWSFGAYARTGLGERLDLRVEGSGSATHHFLPSWGAGGGLNLRLGRGFVVGTGGRWARYESAVASVNVFIANAGLEYYRGPFRLAYTVYGSELDRSWSTSHAVGFDYFYRQGDRIGVVLTIGRELESLGGGRVLATDVLAAALIGRSGLGAGWSLTYGVEMARQGDLYSRSGGRLGVLREF